MNRTEKDVIEIIKEFISGKEAKISENPDWLAIFLEMRSQAVAPLGYDIYKKYRASEFDPVLDQKWSQNKFSQVNSWYYLLEAQQELVDLLSEAGYDFAIMKGIANAVFYPTPELRKSGDIDFLVRWNQYQEVYEFLLKNGYELKEEQEEDKHHLILTKHNVIFELHRRPGGTKLDDSPETKALNQFFEEGIDEVEIIRFGEYSFPVLPVLQNGIMLLVHFAGHMRGGVGFRHLLDWMVYVKEYLTDQYWKDSFSDAAERAGLNELAKVMTKTCQRCFGLNSGLTWCRDADKDLCKKFLEFLVVQGDFGTKAKNDEEVKVLTEASSLKRGFNKLYVSSLYSLPAARDYYILRPAALVYQLLRYVVRGLKMKNPAKTLRKSKMISDERRDMFFRLRV